MIAEELRPLLKDLDDYTTDPENARGHDDRSIKALETSLLRFGQVKAIVGWQGKILAGNGLLLAAQKLGWNKIAVVDVSDMSQSDAIAFALTDNRSAELSHWENSVLSSQLDQLRVAGESLDVLGWSAEDLKFMDKPKEKAPKDATDENKKKRKIELTGEQWETVEAAIERAKLLNDDLAMTDGRCVELIAASYLGSSLV